MSTEPTQTAVQPLGYERRLPIWRAIHNLGADINEALAAGPVPPWVVALEQAVDAAQGAMAAEFEEEGVADD
jgi:hypothetical protein